ncbi:MAG: hypothetical protein ACLP7Q_26990 [Isosphaeraceae bacterium]
MAGERGEINSAVPPAAQRPRPERRTVDFFLAGKGSGVAGVSSWISLVRTFVSVDGRWFHFALARRGRGRSDLIDDDVIPLDRAGRPTGLKHHAPPARGVLVVLGREVLGLDVLAAGTSSQVLLVAIDLAIFGLEGMIFAVALSPDGKEVATASKDGTVKIWSPNSFTERKPAEVLRQ